jgi:hypothetical protein
MGVCANGRALELTAIFVTPLRVAYHELLLIALSSPSRDPYYARILRERSLLY